MYSQCPECQARFRVTAAVLRAARGTVRCGRCGSAFDALIRLTDTLPDETEGSTPGPSGFGVAPAASGQHRGAKDIDPTREAAAEAEFHFSADDIEQVFVDARDWQKRYQPANDAGSAAQDRVDGDAPAPEAGAASSDDATAAAAPGASVVFVHEPEAIEDITLEGERIVIEGSPDLDEDLREFVHADDVSSDDAVRLPGGEPPVVDLESTDQFEILRNVPPSTYPVLAEDVAAEAVDATTTADPAAVPAGATASAVIPTSTAVEPPAEKIVPLRLRGRPPASDDDGLFEEDAEDAGSRRASLAWGLGALLLAVVLIAQATHYFRADLARDPRLGPAVRSIYARLGRPLAPNWDLGAFEVRQWGADDSSLAARDGALLVRASLRNGADFAQPLPWLRVELEDRFGGTLARRDFAPREYLKDPALATRLLGAGATTEAELAIVDAGSDAVGYRLDICLADDGGGLRCAAQATDERSPAPQ